MGESSFELAFPACFSGYEATCAHTCRTSSDPKEWAAPPWAREADCGPTYRGSARLQ